MTTTITKPALDMKTHTVAQFVADFFASEASETIDYSRDLDHQCWNGYVGIVADAGAILEDVVQDRLARSDELAEWYDILEEGTVVFREQMLAARGMPDIESLAAAFGVIVDQHLEV